MLVLVLPSEAVRISISTSWWNDDVYYYRVVLLLRGTLSKDPLALYTLILMHIFALSMAGALSMTVSARHRLAGVVNTGNNAQAMFADLFHWSFEAVVVRCSHQPLLKKPEKTSNFQTSSTHQTVPILPQASSTS